MKGQFSTKTQANLDANGKDITYSETLFNVVYLPKTCPKAGDGILSIDSAYGVGNGIGLAGGIVKQTKGDTTQVYDFDFTNKYDIVLKSVNNGCGIVYFDGSDFQGKPYTMAADFDIKYTFAPVTTMLDGEFIIDPDNKDKHTLNAYIVAPVTKGAGPGHGVIRPGTIFAVDGNISTASDNPNTKGNWFVRYITAVYKNNSCQVAFKNHPASKFFWNSNTGVGSAPNPTPSLWPTAKIISDFTVAQTDRGTIIRQLHGNENLPIHVEDGDCVVQVGMPYGDSTTDPNSHLNMESQANVKSIPD